MKPVQLSIAGFLTRPKSTDIHQSSGCTHGESSSAIASHSKSARLEDIKHVYVHPNIQVSNSSAEQTVSNDGRNPIIRPRKSISRFQSCPLCFQSFPTHNIQSHAAACMGTTEKDYTKTKTPVPNKAHPVSMVQNHAIANDQTTPASRLWKDMTCPMCTHLYVKAHVANPCGHILCASCIAVGGPSSDHNKCPLCFEIVNSFTWTRSYDHMIRNILLCHFSKLDSDLHPIIHNYILTFIQRHQQEDGSLLTWEETECLLRFSNKGQSTHQSMSTLDMQQTNTSCAQVIPTNTCQESSFLVWKRTKTFSSTMIIPTSPPIGQNWSQPLPGLFIFENFITPMEQQDILTYLDTETLAWKFASFNGPHFGKRWGVHCNLRDRKVSKAETPLPDFFHHLLIPKLKEALIPHTSNHLPSHLIAMIQDWNPNEANAIRYHTKMGHALANHCDDRQLSKEMIVNLSLEGDCYMTYRHENKRNQGTQDRGYYPHDHPFKETGKNVDTLCVPGRISEGVPYIQIPIVQKVLLKQGTLQLLTGRSRYDYSHGIRNEDFLHETRVSITLRESPLGY